jgi:ankyrin repeat protein
MRGRTAIMLAAMSGHIETVKFLHAAGASITEKNDEGFSALHLAAHRGRLALLQLMLSKRGQRAHQ